MSEGWYDDGEGGSRYWDGTQWTVQSKSPVRTKKATPIALWIGVAGVFLVGLAGAVIFALSPNTPSPQAFMDACEEEVRHWVPEGEVVEFYDTRTLTDLEMAESMVEAYLFYFAQRYVMDNPDDGRTPEQVLRDVEGSESASPDQFLPVIQTWHSGSIAKQFYGGEAQVSYLDGTTDTIGWSCVGFDDKEGPLGIPVVVGTHYDPRDTAQDIAIIDWTLSY